MRGIVRGLIFLDPAGHVVHRPRINDIGKVGHFAYVIFANGSKRIR